MSTRRAFPKKRDPRFKEANLYLKNVVDSGIDGDFDCPEIVNACKIMDLAQDLSLAGWKVKVAPFEDYPTLHVRAKRKGKAKFK